MISLQAAIKESGCWSISLKKLQALFETKKILPVFLFLHKNICCGYSFEAPHWDTSNEYPQHMLLLRDKKILIWMPAYLGYENSANLIWIELDNMELAGKKTGWYFNNVVSSHCSNWKYSVISSEKR